MKSSERQEQLYNFITGDEDSRVCKDIPEAACSDQPHNFLVYLTGNFLGKIADEIASAKLVIPWIFGTLGVPALFTGFLVPIREAGKLLPQMVIAAAIRRLPYRKGVWVVGALLSGLSLFGMAAAAFLFSGVGAGVAITAMLILFSLAEGLCSVSAKDVLGKTVSKSRRGRLMGLSASISGIVVLAVGFVMGVKNLEQYGLSVFSALLIGGGVLWILGALVFSRITEQPGATSGGGNALQVAWQQLSLLVKDRPFRRFVMVRALLLSVALAPPFYVLVARQVTNTDINGLGFFIVANGLAASLSAPFWGRFADLSSRKVMSMAATGAGILGVLTFLVATQQWRWIANVPGMAIIFFLLTVMHGGLRLGRKVYLVDLSSGDNRAAYLAISNTVIGLLMLVGGLIGVLGDVLGPAWIVLLLAGLSLVAGYSALQLPETSDPA
jgi:hypothetical protein